jgi:hypothetical protein
MGCRVAYGLLTFKSLACEAQMLPYKRKESRAGGREAASACAVSMKQLLSRELINWHVRSFLDTAQLTVDLALRWFE